MKHSKKYKYKKKLDKLWSQIIRSRFGFKCIMCDKTKEAGHTIQAHHCIVGKKAGGNSARYHLENGVAMCYDCHINKLHGRQDKDFKFYDRYVAKIKEIFTEGQREAIEGEIKSTIIKDSELTMIEEKLKCLVANAAV